MGKSFLSLFTVVFFVLLATFPLLHKGFPPTHDGEYHVIRFYEFFKTLEGGSIYPRWAGDLNNGYGVPLFDFVYPLPNYIAALLHSLGFTFIESFKYSLLLATGVGAIGFYFFAKYFTGTLGGLVGSIIYIFTPYRFVDTYVRGSIGEVWSLAIFPCLLWSLAILIKERKYSYVGLSSLLVALLIFSHNILSVLFFPFILSYVLLLSLRVKKRLKSFFLAFCSLILGVGVSAIFWLPALFEKKYVRGLEVYDYRTYFPDLSSLLFPSWGTGFAGDVADGMSTQIGILNLLVVLSALYVCIYYKKRNSLFFFTIIWFFLVVFLMLPFSTVLWETIPLFHFVQFPWRYLSLAILLCSLLAAFFVSIFRWKKVATVSFITIAVATTYSYTKPAYYHARSDEHYISRDNFIHGTNSPGNAFNTYWINRPLPKTAKRVEILSGKGNVFLQDLSPEKYIFRVNALTTLDILVNTAYFPGWEMEASKKKIMLKVTRDGLISFSLPRGEYFVTMKFADTMIRRVGVVISLFSLGVTMFLAIFFIFRKKTK